MGEGGVGEDFSGSVVLRELGILGSISRSISLITLFISQSLQYLQIKGTQNTGVHLPIYFSHYFYVPEFTVLTD